MKMKRFRLFTLSFLMMLLVGAMAYASTNQAQAATIMVNYTNDPGDGVCEPSECTLREALAVASPGDTIVFDLPDNSTIVLNGTHLTVDRDLTIDGSTALGLTISGDKQSRVFLIPSLPSAKWVCAYGDD